MRFLAYRGRCAARAAALIGVVVVTLFAAGCAKADPSVAAYVGNSKITQQQVDDAVEGVSAILEEGQTVSQAAVVNAMIHGLIAEQIAAANKITITDGERDALIKNSNLAGLLNVPKAPARRLRRGGSADVSGKIGSAAYLAAVGEQQVTLNPRFGVLDPEPEDDHHRSVGVPGRARRPPRRHSAITRA